MRYWYPGPDRDVAAAALRIADIEDHWRAYGFGDWGVVSRPDGELVGFAGLHHIADMDEVNIGYVLQIDRWRQGLGCEIAKALLDYAFGHLRLPEVVAVLDPDTATRQQVRTHLAQASRLDGAATSGVRHLARGVEDGRSGSSYLTSESNRPGNSLDKVDTSA